MLLGGAVHIIGNVTKNADNSIKLEPINDCSGVTFYEGIWHVWHQCCQVRCAPASELRSAAKRGRPCCAQSHWDHVISKDLIHWQRLPPPIQPVTTRTWDGSITLLPKADGGPLILCAGSRPSLCCAPAPWRALGPLRAAPGPV